MDDAEHLQQVEQAKAALAVSEARVSEAKSLLEVAQREHERVQSLLKDHVIAQSEVDAAEAQLDARRAQLRVAEAQVKQAEALLRGARVRLSYTQITASWEPREGEPSERVVAERFVDEGAMLSANAAIVTIADGSTLAAVIHVIERDYARLRPDQPVLIETDAHPGRKFPGRVARISPVLRETSRQARVEIEVPNPGETLKPGMFVRAEIEFARKPDAVIGPAAALTRREGVAGVFRVDREARRASFVPVVYSYFSRRG